MCHHCINADFRCLLERAAFDQCFQRSLTATRSSLSNGHFAADSFEDIAQRYVLSLDQCFSTSNPLIIPTSDIAAILVDEDAVYARAIYGLEYADRLWQLPSGLNNPPELDRNSVCLTRLVVSPILLIQRCSIPSFRNNLNTSCLLENTQLRCYKRYLENDQDFQHLVVNQDRALRSCIQRIRIECRNNDGSMMRACLCSAREEFENLLQASLIECVRKFGVLLSGNYFFLISKAVSPLSVTDLGTLINGHCLCSYGKQSLNEFRNFLNDIKPRNEQDVPYRATRTKNKSPEQWESSREQVKNYFLLKFS
uniref:Uncharacterized protein n=1 Tax=Syphacia muris TaxID=451379 RepID=A0A0N5A871_9BILA